MPSPVQCTNCGALMTPTFDGRVYSCPYCKTVMQVGIGVEQLQAGLAIDLSNIDAFLSKLANTLSQGFAEHTSIQANGHYVIAIEINLEPDYFHVHREGQHATATHKKVVRGIALRTKTLALDIWYEQLTNALANHANTNARAAWVLGQIGKPQ